MNTWIKDGSRSQDSQEHQRQSSPDPHCIHSDDTAPGPPTKGLKLLLEQSKKPWAWCINMHLRAQFVLTITSCLDSAHRFLCAPCGKSLWKILATGPTIGTTSSCCKHRPNMPPKMLESPLPINVWSTLSGKFTNRLTEHILSSQAIDLGCKWSMNIPTSVPNIWNWSQY